MLRAGLLTAKRIREGLQSRWRNIYYRALGVQIDGYVWMREIEIPRQPEAIAIACNCSLDRGVILLCSGEPQEKAKICLRKGTYVNRHTFIDASLSIVIGRDCAIGPGCYITDHDHGFALGPSPLEQPLVSQATAIGSEAWLGAHVKVLKGVRIGDRAVIGAGSVVTRDVPDDAIAVGIPAKVVKMRSPATDPE
ncbi:MAG: acyltransferase [Cyanobacteria bacterium P01_D01_bin.123]